MVDSNGQRRLLNRTNAEPVTAAADDWTFQGTKKLSLKGARLSNRCMPYYTGPTEIVERSTIDARV
jgi:hypothetical protein